MEGNSFWAKDEHLSRSCKDCEILRNQYQCKVNELNQLREGHQRLQQVVSEKGAELNFALRKADSNARELKRIRQKYTELKKKEKSKRDSREANKEKENNQENVSKRNFIINQLHKEETNSEFDENTTFSNIFVKSIDEES